MSVLLGACRLKPSCGYLRLVWVGWDEAHLSAGVHKKTEFRSFVGNKNRRLIVWPATPVTTNDWPGRLFSGYEHGGLQFLAAEPNI